MNKTQVDMQVNLDNVYIAENIYCVVLLIIKINQQASYSIEYIIQN